VNVRVCEQLPCWGRAGQGRAGQGRAGQSRSVQVAHELMLGSRKRMQAESRRAELRAVSCEL
jgi:hypothetical protein